MKRILISLLFFSLTFLDAGRRETLRRREKRQAVRAASQCPLKTCDFAWHRHVEGVCKDYDLTTRDVNGDLPLSSVLKDKEMTEKQKAKVVACLVKCGGCPIAQEDRDVARHLWLMDVLPKK